MKSQSTLALPVIGAGDQQPGLQFVVAWYPHNPERLGEVIVVDQPLVLGRASTPRSGETNAYLRQRRPGVDAGRGPLNDPHLSRRQIIVAPAGPTAVKVRRYSGFEGVVDVDGQPLTEERLVEVGSTLLLSERLLLLLVPFVGLPEPRSTPHAFGGPDQDGMVGESAALWHLRDRVSQVAEVWRSQPRRRSSRALDDELASRHMMNVLVLGETGTGKEHVARALHRQSGRSGQWVPCNAAQIPDTLVEYSLFGNDKDCPNPGSPATKGLFGAAHGGTLFLDEVGEASSKVQAALLRVLEDGTYSRIGPSKPLRADIRFVAATNRDPDELKHDLVPRLAQRIQVPPLRTRREDIPLILQHLARRMIREGRPDVGRFPRSGSGELVLPVEMVRRLLCDPPETNVRGLVQVLVN